ncbi:Multimerin-2 [Saguinus oedipus]|uniref:Multimerin-2 n=1 Tax=Saguinus oedipus TaxID=9490 RepID=A0ABQ9UMC4_SAGOE|nr:Multimerin-2 [Saguinus oedipus]
MSAVYSGHLAAVISEVEVQQEQQERLLGDLQNDVHHAADSLPGLWKALPGNLTAATMEANQTEHGKWQALGAKEKPGHIERSGGGPCWSQPGRSVCSCRACVTLHVCSIAEFPDRSLEQVLLPHMDTFLHVYFSPIWRSFNESLHSLAQAIRNLSLDVEANRQAILRVQDSAMVRADFQELGAKFEAKVQENAQRVSQLQQDMEDRLHAQHLTLHRSVSELQVDVDTKLKRLHKAQEARGTNGSLVVATPWAGAKPEPESLQARLGQLQRNLSELRMTTALREKELQNTLEDMRATLAQHGDEIKELYSESDETFDQINKVERQVEELQVNHTALRELRVILMEKSLIMEESKEEVERQLLELNLTLQHLQGGHADLIKYVKDCNCQKLYLDLDVIREGQRGATRALEETQVSLDERRQLDGPSLQALQSAVDAVSLAVDTHKAEGERARAATARLRSQVQALDDEVGALKAAAAEARHEVRQLHSAFAALLEDALRHEAVLAALFGEEVMEEMSEEAPGPLPLSYEQIRVALQDAAIGLQEQALGWDVLAARVAALEQASELPRPAEHLEPSHDVGHEEAATTTLAGLARELQSLSREVQHVAGCCEAEAEAGAVSFKASLDGLHSALSATQRSLEQHQQLFHSLFGNFQGLMAANVSLDLGKLQTILSRKEKKQQKGLEAPRKRDKKEAETLVDGRITGPVPGALGTALGEAGEFLCPGDWASLGGQGALPAALLPPRGPGRKRTGWPSVTPTQGPPSLWPSCFSELWASQATWHMARQKKSQEPPASARAHEQAEPMLLLQRGECSRPARAALSDPSQQVSDKLISTTTLPETEAQTASELQRSAVFRVLVRPLQKALRGWSPGLGAGSEAEGINSPRRGPAATAGTRAQHRQRALRTGLPSAWREPYLLGVRGIAEAAASL